MSGDDNQVEDRVPDDGLFDWISRSDDILADVVVPILADARDYLKSINEGFEVEFQAQEDTLFVVEETPEYRTVSFSAWVEPDTSQARVTREMPFDGVITEVIAGFRGGTQNGVGMRVESTESGEKYFPSNPETQFYGAEAFTHPFKVNVHVNNGEEVDAVYRNTDEENGHFINCLLTVKKE